MDKKSLRDENNPKQNSGKQGILPTIEDLNANWKLGIYSLR